MNKYRPYLCFVLESVVLRFILNRNGCRSLGYDVRGRGFDVKIVAMIFSMFISLSQIPKGGYDLA